MEQPINILCQTLKKILVQLNPQQRSLSFLILAGKEAQGKSTLLSQSPLTPFPIETEKDALFYYNQAGIILELGEDWFHKHEYLMADVLTQLNRCHRYLKITGLILCIDCNELLLTEAALIERCRLHVQFFRQFSKSLAQALPTAVMVTKVDQLAGFCDFFETEHPSDLIKPLGFSLKYSHHKNKLVHFYREKFDNMIEVLGHQVITKLHPVRSGLKRILVREFPLQLASLRLPLQMLIQSLVGQNFLFQGIFFTSAKQGGISVDRLNKKIQNEYALVVQDNFYQARNYRAFFIEGALTTIQEQTKRPFSNLGFMQKSFCIAASVLVVFSMSWMVYHHLKAKQILDEASKALLRYEWVRGQGEDETKGIYYLSQASTKLENLSSGLFKSSALGQIKRQLQLNTAAHMHDKFLPNILDEIETVISNGGASLSERYKALKIYLMLGDPLHYTEAAVMAWFIEHWKLSKDQIGADERIGLLKKLLKQPMQALPLHPQIVSDARNYFKALPSTYFYYALAKVYFPAKVEEINISGFDLPHQHLPFYFTKAGFQEVKSNLPLIASKLQDEAWVLGDAIHSRMQFITLLEEAYCFEYLTWWQHFLKQIRIKHFDDFYSAKLVMHQLQEAKAFSQLMRWITAQIEPDSQHNQALFNQKIASQFTHLNLMTQTAVQDIQQNLFELEKFLTTLSLINDNGRTAFELTRARFQNGLLSDPLSLLYLRAKQLPEPLSGWVKQVADDAWGLFIQQSRHYLNLRWKETVYSEYKSSIASRYPFEGGKDEIEVNDFDHFFSPQGTLTAFFNQYLKPFIDTSQAQWQVKALDGFVFPLSASLIDELIRANVISNMFFPEGINNSKIAFSLQKIDLDPLVAYLELNIGKHHLKDSQDESEGLAYFYWPQSDASLLLDSIEGKHYSLEEKGPWAFFKLLEKVNVVVNTEDSKSLQILFEINGNSGRYWLKTENTINPFSPGVLNGFALKEEIA